MKKLIEFFVDRSFLVNLIAAAICIFGVIAAINTNRDLIPAFEFKHIGVEVSLPGASPEEVERLVTFPIEEALRNLPHIEKIYSNSWQGRSSIGISYLPSAKDMSLALERVKERVESLRITILPRSIKEITVRQSRVDSVDFLFAGIRHSEETNPDHRRWLKAISESLRRIPGIVKVEPHMRKYQVMIEFDPAKLADHGISVSQARTKILDHISFTPVGELKIDEKRIAIEIERSDAKQSLYENIPISSNRTGQVIYLKDLAEVRFEFPPRDTLFMINGEKDLTFDIYKDTASDAITLRDEINEVFADYNKKLPKPLEVEVLGDGPVFIEKQLSVLKRNGLTGFILVLIALTLFLGFRTTFFTMIGLPVAYLGTLLIFRYFGLNIDLISVVGMILIVGVLVDDAIIVAERYSELVHKGLRRREAAVQAAHSLIGPVTGTILTTIVAFLPILVVESHLNTVLFSIPIVVIGALLLSWIECFFILPNHLRHFVGREEYLADRFFPKLRSKFERLLSFFLKWRYVALALFIGFTIGTAFIGKEFVKNNFRFRIGSERVTIYAELKESSSLQETEKALEPLHDYLKDIPKEEVALQTTRIGRVWIDGKEKSGYRYARVRLYVTNLAAAPTELKKRLQADIESKLKELKTDQFENFYVQTKMAGSDKKKENMVSVRVKGGDELPISQIRSEIVDAVKGIEHTTLANLDESELFRDSWKFQVNRAALAQYQISARDLAGQLAEIFDLREIGKDRYEGDQIWIYSRIGSDQHKPKDLNAAGLLAVVNPTGLDIPLSYLGKWEKTRSLKTIRHENAKRLIEVDLKFDPEKTKQKDIQKAVSERTQTLASKYPTFQFENLDADEEARKNKKWASESTVLCVGLILFVLAIVLGSVTQPMLVGLAIPFGILGIIWALFLHNMELGVMAIIGLLGVAGVAVNDSLIMVDCINRMKKPKERLSRDIIVKGASSRLRAITLTTITTLGGVFPMAYGLGGESGFTQPLAFSMGWGLAFATFLTLFFLPLLLEIREDIITLITRLWNRLPRFKKKQAIELPVPSTAILSYEEGYRIARNSDENTRQQPPKPPSEEPREISRSPD